LLRRIWPERRGRQVLVNLPPIVGAHDIGAALGAITNAVAIGELTPDEGAALAAPQPTAGVRIIAYPGYSILPKIQFSRQSSVLSRNRLTARNFFAIDVSMSEP
jgi:hypothetical protein